MSKGCQRAESNPILEKKHAALANISYYKFAVLGLIFSMYLKFVLWRSQYVTQMMMI